MNYLKIINRFIRKLNRIWFTPIEVLVFHAVSDHFDASKNEMSDWISTKEFKKKITEYKKTHQFISIQDATNRLKKDRFRRKRCVVLTCDDGDKSVLSILPFLQKEDIPITLFINTKYLDGVSIRNNYAEHPEYILKKELFEITSANVTIAMHGYEHLDATRQSYKEFEESISKSIQILSDHPRFAPFFAYTWGRYNEQTQKILFESHIIPVFCDGEDNYRYTKGISRKPLF